MCCYSEPMFKKFNDISSLFMLYTLAHRLLHIQSVFFKCTSVEYIYFSQSIRSRITSFTLMNIAYLKCRADVQF